MCGRFTLIADMDLIVHRFKIAYLSDGLQLLPRYNIAPSQQVLAVVNDGEKNRLGQLRWGLIPSWAKDTRIGNKLINARAETVDEKASFRRSFARRRCLILADSFYEWKQGDGKKMPFRIRLKSGELFAFAGLWDRWVSPEGEAVYSCTIVTTSANALMTDIHGRMPVILQREDEEVWLDRGYDESDDLKQLLQPYPAEQMEAYEVSPFVNSPRHDTSECIKRV